MFNAQSVPLHIDEIKDFVNKRNPSVLLLTETHLTTNIDDFEVSIDGYDILRVDSTSRHTGGVCVYIKQGLKYTRVNEYVVHKNYWVLAVKVTIKKWTATVTCIYRSPNGSQARFLEFFEGLCEEYSTASGRIILMGDFNINWGSDLYYPEKLKRISQDNGLVQLVNEVTHVTSETRTTIDLVFTNDGTLGTRLLNNSGISCHRAVMLLKEVEVVPETVISVRSKILDKAIVERKIREMRVDYKLNNLNLKVSTFLNDLTEVLEFCSPKRKLVFRNKQNAWFNETVERAIKDRNEAYSRFVFTDSLEDWNEYKMRRNAAVKILQSEKKKYYERK